MSCPALARSPAAVFRHHHRPMRLDQRVQALVVEPGARQDEPRATERRALFRFVRGTIRERGVTRAVDEEERTDERQRFGAGEPRRLSPQREQSSNRRTRRVRFGHHRVEIRQHESRGPSALRAGRPARGSAPGRTRTREPMASAAGRRTTAGAVRRRALRGRLLAGTDTPCSPARTCERTRAPTESSSRPPAPIRTSARMRRLKTPGSRNSSQKSCRGPGWSNHNWRETRCAQDLPGHRMGHRTHDHVASRHAGRARHRAAARSIGRASRGRTLIWPTVNRAFPCLRSRRRPRAPRSPAASTRAAPVNEIVVLTKVRRRTIEPVAPSENTIGTPMPTMSSTWP